MTPIPISQIERNEDFWPRQRMVRSRVKEFAELYRDEGPDALPPIIVADAYEDGTHLLIDGWHRVAAAEEVGLDALPAEVQEVGSDDAAYVEAVKLSAISSQPLTRAEKRQAVDVVLRICATDADFAVARMVGVSNRFVAKRRRLLQDGASEERGQGANSDELQRRAAALLRAAEALWNERGLWASVTGGGEKKLAFALSEAAAMKHGDEAGMRLHRLQRIAAIARDRLKRGGGDE